MQSINVLDMRTLLAGNVVCLLICVIFMGVAWRYSHGRFPATGYWLRSLVMAFVGTLLLALRGLIPDFLSIMLPVALVVVGMIHLRIGLERYLGKERRRRSDYVLLAACLLIHGYFAYVEPSIPFRAANYALFLLLVSAQCAWLMLFRVDPDKRFGTTLVGAVMIGYVILNVGRLVFCFLVPPSNDFFEVGMYDAALYLTYQVLNVALTCSLVLMVNRRLHAELENDVRRLVRSEIATRMSEERLARAELAAKSGNWELSLDSGLIVGSAGAAKVYGVSADCLHIAAIRAIPLPEYRPRLDAALADLIRGGVPYDVEFRIQAVDTGEIKDVHSIATFDRATRTVFGVIQDVTDRKNVERELERLAQVDPLTGVFSRRHFMALAEKELARTSRYGGPLSVLMLDVDHFKKVNDTHGHQVGDRVLNTLGEVFCGILREVDMVGRIGGEEFAMVLPATSVGQAGEVAERLRRAVERREIALERGLPLYVTVSIGVASLAAAGVNIDTLMGRADQALYEAKNQGRNRVRVFAEEARAEA